ncbi:MurR/RpiR family transcriptional regulator [uncultured Trichococcus sp.]|uniref:MurR/RpiR family transcriptional regulator n=1 Tax=uncultured Trichococcus sp. TaxID=189665 RepID=UPI0029C6DAAC|nr:MurR/RpiR family transcriptional regulator [uncultured Trichococcus sp.]
MHYKVIHQLKERNFDREYSESESAVLDYLEEHFQQIPSMTVIKVAAESFTSQATVNRTCKLLGFVGYSQLKYAIDEDIKLMHQKSFSHVMDTEYMISKIDFETSTDLVKHMIKSRSKLLLFGLGGSHISAQYLQRQLLYLSITSVIVSETQMLKLFPNYTIVILSSSGETQRCLQLINEARKAKMNILSITKKGSSVMRGSDLTFCHDVPIDKVKSISREQQLHMMVMVHEIVNQMQSAEFEKMKR